jgi:segregation and condensation protein A
LRPGQRAGGLSRKAVAEELLRGSLALTGEMPQITLPVFEGPLDLLLHLIERDDLDITAVSLVSVADQYLGAIREGEGYEARALAEFVAIGAKLIYLKSRALLPRMPMEAEEELEEDDVGRELVDMLVEYRRYATVTTMLQQRQDEGLRFYTRSVPPPEVPEGPGLDHVTMELLRKIMLDVMKRKPPSQPRAVIPRDSLSLRQQIDRFRNRLRTAGKFSFRRVMAECRTRVEVVVAFLAVLELLKSGEADARQAEAWGDIEVVALDKAA